jgi:hypothetical protein
VSPIIFHVEAAGGYRPVELTFAAESEVRRLRTWRKTMPVTDATEFAALAAKRWFYYSREGATIDSLAGFHTAIRKNARAELAFLLVASANWAGRYKFLALAYCRRTWCHHLVLDFLAVRPAISVSNQPVRGLGTGMLAGLMSLADSLEIGTIWGEATASSAAFYENVLQVGPVNDLFIVNRTRMRQIARTYFANQKRRLAGATETGQVILRERSRSKEA